MESKWSEHGDIMDMREEKRAPLNWWSKLHWGWKIMIIAGILRIIIYIIRVGFGIGF